MPSQLSDIVKIATVDRSLRKVLTKDLGDPLAHDFGASAAFQKDCFGDHCFEHTYHGIKKKHLACATVVTNKKCPLLVLRVNQLAHIYI